MNSSLLTVLFAVLALAVTLALAWLLLKGLASLGRRSAQGRDLRIKATLPVGSRERLMVVEYRGADYLLGVTPGGLSLIDKHTDPDSGHQTIKPSERHDPATTHATRSGSGIGSGISTDSGSSGPHT